MVLTRAEYEDLVDARDHAIAMREVATGTMEKLPDAEVDAYLAAPTPLRFWRVHRGLTQADLAVAAGMSQHLLANVETGSGELAVGTLARLARALRLRMEDLVTDEDELGRVRVRSYVVERPVEEQVSLHEERVTIERQPVNRPLTEADRVAAFGERTIEATASAEEAVVGKDVRVVEEIGIRKEAADRVQTVRDTVRRTEVEVDDQTAKTGGTNPRVP